jgi:hypothetical protein
VEQEKTPSPLPFDEKRRRGVERFKVLEMIKKKLLPCVFNQNMISILFERD